MLRAAARAFAWGAAALLKKQSFGSTETVNLTAGFAEAD